MYVLFNCSTCVLFNCTLGIEAFGVLLNVQSIHECMYVYSFVHAVCILFDCILVFILIHVCVY